MESGHPGGGSAGASSPLSVEGTGGHQRNGSILKRKRSGVDFESSPGSGHEHEDAEERERRRQPGVKRACKTLRIT